MKKSLSFLVGALFLAVLLSACAPRQRLYTETWLDLFDTAANVQGYAESEAAWDAQAAALLADLQRYNELFDIYAHHDGVVDLYDVNAGAAAAPVAVGDELYTFLDWCKNTACPATDGATNIAAGAVLRLWHDARESDAPAPPDDAALAEALQHIDLDDLVLDPDAQTVYFADPALQLDVGAVAKGYAVEHAAQAAEARGLQSALLNVGGDVRAIGTKPGGQRWTAGVENPWESSGSPVATLSMAPGSSLVISGDYQRYFEYDGVRYAHLIDLTTGQPARYCNSVAVYAEDAQGDLADALSTGLFCLPQADGLALINAADGMAALWMNTDQSLTASADWP